MFLITSLLSDTGRIPQMAGSEKTKSGVCSDVVNEMFEELKEKELEGGWDCCSENHSSWQTKVNPAALPISFSHKVVITSLFTT